ncbi:MAG: hypothetical protein Q8O22_03330 [Candidatus Omnitrophota bacterium]|nr:hypothetical protein [Candidatus Omnitrophota bacterium]
MPKGVKSLPDYWYCKKAAVLGAKRRYELYGNPGTVEGRRKGGLSSIRKFHADPDFAKRVGFQLRKEIRRPGETAELAEFIGIVIGDGGIRDGRQVAVTFGTAKEKPFAKYVQGMINRLFGLSSSIYPKKGALAADVVVSSVSLAEYLREKLENKKVHRSLNRTDLPGWVLKNSIYKASCLRGLMDTDGGVYCHRYKIRGKWYQYPRLSFCSTSPFLLHSVCNILKDLEFTPKIGRYRVTLYRLPELKRYFDEIGTHNPKHSERYAAFCNNSN